MFVSKVYKLGFTSFRFVRIRVLQSRSGLSSVKHLINGNPGNLQPVPFGRFLYLDSEVSQLKPANLNNRTEASRRQHVAANIPLSAKRMNQHSLAFDEIAFVGLHCRLIADRAPKLISHPAAAFVMEQVNRLILDGRV